jgi:hypothetical protein
MVAEVSGIVTSAVNKARLATAEKSHAHQVHARRVHYPTIMPDVPFPVYYRYIQPRQVGVETGRPNYFFTIDKKS